MSTAAVAGGGAPPRTAAGASTGPPPGHDHRHGLTSLVGRERELAAVRRLLTETRVVTLTGPGGIGKTRLALAAADRSGGAFPDGVRFVPLASLQDPSLVLGAIATVVGVQEAADRPLTDRLVEALRAKRLLLVLDNFEPVLAAGPAVAGLLAACPGVRALVTSREPLRVSGSTGSPCPRWRSPTPRSRPPPGRSGGARRWPCSSPAHGPPTRASRSRTRPRRRWPRSAAGSTGCPWPSSSPPPA